MAVEKIGHGKAGRGIRTHQQKSVSNHTTATVSFVCEFSSCTRTISYGSIGAGQQCWWLRCCPDVAVDSFRDGAVAVLCSTTLLAGNNTYEMNIIRNQEVFMRPNTNLWVGILLVI